MSEIDERVVRGLRGDSLPLDSPDPAAGALVARYIDDEFVAMLFILPPSLREFEQEVEIYKREGQRGLSLRLKGGGDWYGPVGERPPETFWMSGLTSSTGGASFVTGAVTQLEHLKLIHHIGTGGTVNTADAPTGAFIARLRYTETSPTEG